MSADADDRLSFGEGPLGGPLDEPDAGAAPPRRRNRAFVYIAIAMAGLVLLGVLALVAAMTIWLPAQRERQAAAVASTTQAGTRIVLEWTATPLATATALPATPTATQAPTQTPVPTPTSTRVVSVDRQETLAVTSTPTRVVQPGEGDGTTPAAGLGAGGMAAIAVGLSGLLYVSRKLRGQG